MMKSHGRHSTDSGDRTQVAAPRGERASPEHLAVAEERRRTREQLQLITDTLPALVSYVGTDLRFRFVNSTYERWLGRKREDILGKPVSEVLGEAVYCAIRERLERALLGEQQRFETVVDYADERRHVQVTYVPHRGECDRVEGLVALVHDVTQERRTQAEREELLRLEQIARERFALLARLSDALASSLDYETVLRRVTELALPMLGDFCVFDLVQPGGALRRVVHAYQDPELQQELSATRWERHLCRSKAVCALAAGAPTIHTQIDDAWMVENAESPEQLTLLRSLGISSMISVPLRYQGKLLGAISLFYGRSRKQHAEGDLWLAEELARRAAASLINARLFAEAQEAIHIRDDFLSIAGHELRTPLTALQLQVLSMARLIAQGETGRKLASRAEKASRNVLRLSELVDDLLDVSRIGAGRLTLERTPIDLTESVRSVVSRLGDEFARAECTVDLDLRAGIVGSWDQARIEQVIANLMSNAVRYGRGMPIEVRSFAREGCAYLRVRNFGAGISDEDRNRIFQRFERAASTHGFGGVGLGLWITRQLVEIHGGTIRVQSAPDDGATLEVMLPLEPPAAPPA